MIQLKCPDCGSVLTLDVDGKRVVVKAHEKPKPPKVEKKPRDADDMVLAMIGGGAFDDDDDEPEGDDDDDNADD